MSQTNHSLTAIPKLAFVHHIAIHDFPFSLFPREASCSYIYMKGNFPSKTNKAHFHMNSCTPGVALKERLKAIQKWTIGTRTVTALLSLNKLQLGRKLILNSQYLIHNVVYVL